ncbi:MAG: type II toxin-antitoxin system RelE/ParE family toxin [Melioribacteraceae bacterium]|nr:type II toxin-antitoxin system RelE/ParE family toxin [Melioribacteraceae bacterium]MCF8395311.1 type II toxin-antitoxin system RelE/ParE family toxin [Melioribacteraceae bacterium]MCF8420333.1 type II toxin-antitoxin system RelE/ParE family toxin [Melioribacteraceae bacterium]
MIKSIKHKGLERFFKTGNSSGILHAHKNKLRMRLAALHTANVIKDMDLPGFRLHQLKGKMENLWSIDVSDNWRLTFKFEDGNVFLLDYKDYH